MGSCMSSQKVDQVNGGGRGGGNNSSEQKRLKNQERRKTQHLMINHQGQNAVNLRSTLASNAAGSAPVPAAEEAPDAQGTGSQTIKQPAASPAAESGSKPAAIPTPTIPNSNPPDEKPTKVRTDLRLSTLPPDGYKGSTGKALEMPQQEDFKQEGDVKLPIIVGAAMKMGICEGKDICQDYFCGDLSLGGDPYRALFALFDGHGAGGEVVSRYLAYKLPIRFKEVLQETKACSAHLFEDAFNRAEMDLLQERKNEATHGGSTCVSAFIDHNTLWVGNVGDSRCVGAIANKATGKLEAKDLSLDQKPVFPPPNLLHNISPPLPFVVQSDPQERERIEKMGGCVRRWWNPDEPEPNWLPDWAPYRVFKKNSHEPGIAMSRSFGDGDSSTFGVIAAPVICRYDIDSSYKFIVMASDGVWDHIESQEAVEFVDKYDNVNEAADELLREAERRWFALEDAPPYIVDDISVVIVAMAFQN